MRCRHQAVIVGDAHRDADRGGEQDADEQSAAHFLDNQNRGDRQTDHGQQRGAARDLAQRDQRSIVAGDDAGILQADKSDEKSDPGADSILERGRDGIHDGLAQIRKRKYDEDDSFEEHGCQGKLPRITHAHTYRKHEESVESHSRGQPERQLGPQRHNERSRDSGQRRCGEHRTGRHPFEQAEHTGVHRQNVRHGKENRDTGQYLRAQRSYRRIKSENLFQHIFTAFAVVSWTPPGKNDRPFIFFILFLPPPPP